MSGQSNGISFMGMLGIVFIVLKLTHTIDWGWWLVTLPLWGGLAVAGAIMVGGLAIAGLFALIALIAAWTKR